MEWTVQGVPSPGDQAGESSNRWGVIDFRKRRVPAASVTNQLGSLRNAEASELAHTVKSQQQDQHWTSW